jgi:hypothetical protein
VQTRIALIFALTGGALTGGALAGGLAVPLFALFPGYRPARMADGHPNLNGVWQAFVAADFDLQDHEAKPGQTLFLGNADSDAPK